MCQLTVFWKQTCSKVLLGRSGIERERRMWRKDEGVYQTLGNSRVNRHFSRGQTVNILSLWPNGLSQLTQLGHCSTNTCHRQFLNEDESHSNLIYGDWDLYFTWFPCVTEYSFSFDFFFFFLIFATCKCKNHSWLTHHTKAGGGFDWALGEELADSWAIVSEKRGWWGEVVFTLLLAGDVFRNGTHHPWRHPALVKKRRARRLLLSLFLRSLPHLRQPLVMEIRLP